MLEQWESYVFKFVACMIVLNVIYWLYKRFFPTCSGGRDEKGTNYFYDYTDADGPHTWREKFNVKGQNQSPINLLSVGAVMCRAEEPLLNFSPEFNGMPAEAKISNDYNSVVLFAMWSGGKRASVCGGPLCDDYKFHSMRFHWGPNNEEGSEHMIDMKRYAMELQLTFNKCPCKYTEGMSNRGASILVISYIFEVTCSENPYLEPIIHALQFIQYPCRSCCIRPFPLCMLAPIFNRSYFSYMGSLTHPPCTEGVRWIIQPEPLTVSADQVEEFRRLIGPCGRIYSNVRPVQSINNRCIMFYE